MGILDKWNVFNSPHATHSKIPKTGSHNSGDQIYGRQHERRDISSLPRIGYLSETSLQPIVPGRNSLQVERSATGHQNGLYESHDEADIRHNGAGHQKYGTVQLSRSLQPTPNEKPLPNPRSGKRDTSEMGRRPNGLDREAGIQPSPIVRQEDGDEHSRHNVVSGPGPMRPNLWSWIPHLEQSADDKTITTKVRQIFVAADQFVNNFYIDESPKDTLPSLNFEVIDLHHLPTDVALSSLLRDAVYPTSIIKHCLVSILLTSISLENDGGIPSVLPQEFITLTRALRKSTALENEAPHLHAAVSAYRILTHYIRRDVTDDKRYIDERNTSIDRIAATFESLFFHWNNEQRQIDERLGMLTDLLEKTADLGILFFSQASTFFFDWRLRNPPATTTQLDIPIWPDLLKLFDENACELRVPQIMVKMKIETTDLIKVLPLHSDQNFGSSFSEGLDLDFLDIISGDDKLALAGLQAIPPIENILFESSRPRGDQENSPKHSEKGSEPTPIHELAGTPGHKQSPPNSSRPRNTSFTQVDHALQSVSEPTELPVPPSTTSHSEIFLKKKSVKGRKKYRYQDIPAALQIRSPIDSTYQRIQYPEEEGRGRTMFKSETIADLDHSNVNPKTAPLYRPELAALHDKNLNGQPQRRGTIHHSPHEHHHSTYERPQRSDTSPEIYNVQSAESQIPGHNMNIQVRQQRPKPAYYPPSAMTNNVRSSRVPANLQLTSSSYHQSQDSHGARSRSHSRRGTRHQDMENNNASSRKSFDDEAEVEYTYDSDGHLVNNFGNRPPTRQRRGPGSFDTRILSKPSGFNRITAKLFN